MKRRFLRGWEQCPMSRGLKRPTKNSKSPAQWQAHISGCYFTALWLKAPAWKIEKSVVLILPKGASGELWQQTQKTSMVQWIKNPLSLTGGHNGVPVLQVANKGLGGLVVGWLHVVAQTAGSSSHWVKIRRQMDPAREGPGRPGNHLLKAFLFCTRDIDPISF